MKPSSEEPTVWRRHQAALSGIPATGRATRQGEEKIQKVGPESAAESRTAVAAVVSLFRRDRGLTIAGVANLRLPCRDHRSALRPERHFLDRQTQRRRPAGRPASLAALL